MTEPSLALQTAVRGRLLDTLAVTSLVEPAHIVEGWTRPGHFPTVLFGAAQTVPAGRSGSWRHVWVYLDLHVWTLEGGTEGARAIANAIDHALVAPLTVPGFQLIDGNFNVTDTRFMRDPSEAHGHGIVSVAALLGEFF